MLHAWFEAIANELNNSGLDMRTVLKPEVEIPWDKDSVKRYLFHPIERIMLEKESTRDLTTAEVSRVADVLHRHLAEKFHVDIPFIVE